MNSNASPFKHKQTGNKLQNTFGTGIHMHTYVAIHTHTHTHTHPFSGPLSRTTWVSRYQKGKTNLDFTRARDSEWKWNPLGHMQICTLLQTDNHASTPPLSFLQAGCPSCRPTNSVKALKAFMLQYMEVKMLFTWIHSILFFFQFDFQDTN